MIEVEELVKNIIFLIEIKYNGVINVGGKKNLTIIALKNLIKKY